MTMINSDTLRERLRERLQEPKDDDAHCPCCHVMLTSADREDAEVCTNCGSVMDSDDEDLRDEGYYDGWETRYDG